MKDSSFFLAGSFLSIALLSVGCSDGGDDTDGTGGAASGGASTGETPSGGTSSGGSGVTASGGGPSTGGVANTGGGGGEDLDELFADALERCSYLQIGVAFQLVDDDIARRLTGRIADSSLTTENGSETMAVEVLLGHQVELSWAATAQPGDRVPVKGFLHQESASGSRDRCFEGEVIVREDVGLDGLYFVFASRRLFEATPDGVCGAATEDIVALGCISEDS